MVNSARHRSPAIASLFRRISRQTGLSFPASRAPDLAAGIARVMERHGIEEVGQVIERLGETRIFDDVISELTVSETYFFRDPAQFEAIRRTVLPSLLRIRPDMSPIRIWSAGCSTGEEPYSVAILMDEEGLLERARVLATDISLASLRNAREADYGEWSFRDDGISLSERYFTRNGDRFKLDERLRTVVTFQPLDLGSDVYPSWRNGTAGLDLILCRNVLMYFERRAMKRVAFRFFQCLEEGGWLLTGPSDPPLWEHAPFETTITPAGVLYRRGPNRRGPNRNDAKTAGGGRKSGQPESPQPADANSAAPTGRLNTDYKSPRTDETSGHAMEEYAARIRSLTDAGKLPQALRAASEAVEQHPLSPELHYLQCVVFMAEHRTEEAIAAIRRALYLDRRLAAAHFLLGQLMENRDPQAALRAFRNAVALCAARPSGEALPLIRGYTAGRLAKLAGRRMAKLTRKSAGGE